MAGIGLLKLTFWVGCFLFLSASAREGRYYDGRLRKTREIPASLASALVRLSSFLPPVRFLDHRSLTDSRCCWFELEPEQNSLTRRPRDAQAFLLHA